MYICNIVCIQNRGYLSGVGERIITFYTSASFEFFISLLFLQSKETKRKNNERKIRNK